MKIVILKYNAGNIHSVRLALQRQGIEPVVTDDAEEIRQADKVIFPGVGEAHSAMTYLKSKNLYDLIPSLSQPVLGICLGLQLMCRHSEENDTTGMGIFPADVKKFPPVGKVPHMGWNALLNIKGVLFNQVDEGSYAYFVHSYYAEETTFATAVTSHTVSFASAVEKDNFFAVQFHPEKSARVGEQILRNFIAL